MKRSAFVRRLAFGLGAGAVSAMLACVDETHDAQVAALGGEAPGVSPGPDHRPGQPCVLCHGTAGPASTVFSVAGTIYAVQGQRAPAVGAKVNMEDVNGHTYTFTTNAAGNFYGTPGQWSPTYPLAVNVAQGQDTQMMISHVGRNGSCASCHTDPPSVTSPGAVYAATAPVGSPEGGP
jgi:hypothetical protein